MTLTVGSLFAGIGGFDLGLERAGMRVLWQVEIDEFCNRVLAKHWPEVKRYGDVREISGDDLEAVDLICGGFPCQPFSYSGREKGIDDPRWLWPEFARVVSEVYPKYVLIENVPGVLLRGLGDILRDLAALGYFVEWDYISSRAFGTPHGRERTFIVAYSNNVRCCGNGTGKQEWEHQEMEREQQSWINGRKRILAGIPRTLSTWRIEPPISRVAHGVPDRVDRLRSLGNAVVPAVVEFIGRKILEADHAYCHRPEP